jgi:hypothetical protein
VSHFAVEFGLNKKIGRLNVTYRHKIDQAARNKDGSISRRSNVGKEAYQANIEISNLYKDYDALYNSKFDKINRVERLFYLTLASFFGLLWLLFAWDSSIVFNSNDKFQSIIGLAMLSATSLIVSVPVGLIAKIYSAIKTKHVKCAILDLINGKSLNYRDKSNKGNLIVWLASAVVFYFITVNTNEFLFGKPFAYNINYLVGDELASDCEMYYVLPSKLNVRGKSNSKSNVVGKLTKGEGVCISRVENNWGLIVHSKNDEPYGWASMKYLVENSQKL